MMASIPFDSMPPPRGLHPNDVFFPGPQNVRFDDDEYQNGRRPGPAWSDEDPQQRRSHGHRVGLLVETHYKGFILEKAPAAKGQKSSWARVRPHSLPFDQAKLAEISRKAQEKPGKGLSASWLALSSTQKAVVNQLIEQQQALEKNKNAVWVVENVHRVVERANSGWGTTAECKKIRVILKRTHKHAGAHGSVYTDPTRGMEARDIDIAHLPQRSIAEDDSLGARAARRNVFNDGFDNVVNNNERGPPRPPHRIPFEEEFDPRGRVPMHMPIDPAFGMPPQPLPAQAPFNDRPMGPPPMGRPPMPAMHQFPPSQPGPPPGHADSFPPGMPMQGPPFHGAALHDQPRMQHPGPFDGPPPGQPPMHGAQFNGFPPPGNFPPQPPLDNSRGPPMPNPFGPDFEPGFPPQGGPMHNNHRGPDPYPPQPRPQSRHDLPAEHDTHRFRQLRTEVDGIVDRLEDRIDALKLSGGTTSPDSLGYDGSRVPHRSGSRRHDSASPSDSPTWSSPSRSSGRYSTPPTSHGSYSPKIFDPPPPSFRRPSPLSRRNSASPRDNWLRSSFRDRDLDDFPRDRLRDDDDDDYHFTRSRSTSDGRRPRYRGSSSHVRFRDVEREPSRDRARGRSRSYHRDYDSYARRPSSPPRRRHSSSDVRGIYDDVLNFVRKAASVDDHPDAATGRARYPRRSALRGGRYSEDGDYDRRPRSRRYYG